jgi:hypothetical protein
MFVPWHGEKVSAKWLADHPGSWRHVKDIPKEAGLLVRKDGDDENDVTLVSRAGDCSPPYEPTSPPTPVTATVTNRSAKAELLRGTKATISEATGPKTETTPLAAMGRKRGRSGGRQIKKQKLPAEISKAGRKRSPERIRIVLDSLRENPLLSNAASKAGIHRKTLEYWLKRSAAGDAGYDIEWQGLEWRFHEHCEAARDEAYDKLLGALWDIAMGGEVYKTDESLLSLGYEGPDAYLRDENGNPVVETIRNPNGKMLRFLLELLRPEKWGKRRKRYVPQKGGVLIIGNTPKKPDKKPVNSSAASSKARQWKALSRRIREAKP